MPTTQQLREQRANVWSQMTEVMDRASSENRDLSAEERTTYDRAEADLDRLEADIERQTKYEARAADMNRVDRTGVVTGDPAADQDPKDKAYARAFNAWARGGMESLDADDKKVLRSGFVDAKELQNAAGVSTGGAGGYTVPPAFRNRVIEQMNFVASMRQYAELISTDSGTTLPWPTVDDTANEGAILAENTQMTEQDVTFGTASIGAYMYTSKLVRVSFQLLNDAGFDVEGFLGRIFGNRIGRVQNRHFTVGTGTGQPLGLVTAAAVGKVGATGQTTTYTYDDLVDLTDSIDPAYLESGNVRFMMSQSARKVVRKLKDGQNRPLWEPSVQAGTPDTLLGYGLSLNNYVPIPAASAKSIVFGDIREGYLVRDVNDFQMVQLRERYADFLQVGFFGFQRSDGTLQNGSAVRTYQHSAT